MAAVTAICRRNVLNSFDAVLADERDAPPVNVTTFSTSSSFTFCRQEVRFATGASLQQSSTIMDFFVFNSVYLKAFLVDEKISGKKFIAKECDCRG